MGSYARFEHYLTTLEVETSPEFWPPSPVSGPYVRRRRATLPLVLPHESDQNWQPTWAGLRGTAGLRSASWARSSGGTALENAPQHTPASVAWYMVGPRTGTGTAAGASGPAGSGGKSGNRSATSAASASPGLEPAPLSAKGAAITCSHHIV